MAKLSELAAKAQRKPYELDLEDGAEPVLIAHPVAAKWIEAVEGNNLEGFLRVLGVSDADTARAAAAMPDQPLGTSGELVASMRVHFGLGN